MTKNILVTGGAGFIGTNLVEELISRGNTVKVLDNLSVGDNNVKFLESIGAKICKADISEFENIKDFFIGVDTVFHLAAMNRAQKSIKDPLRANDVNISGCLNCLESARLAGVTKFVNISSSSVYAGRDCDLVEDMPTAPPHPYGVGKLAGEHYTRVYKEIYGMDTVTLRYFSVYGPRQLGGIDMAGVIAKFIHKAKVGETLEVYGDGTKMRNFSFVKDVVNLTILASEKPEAVGQIINVAAKREVDINEIIKILRDNIDKEIKVDYIEELKGDPDRNPPSVEKANKILGYKAQFDFEDGIKKSIGWYDEVFGGNK